MFYPLLLVFSLLPILPLVASVPAAHHPKHHDLIFTLHNITYSSEVIYSTPAHLAVADATIAFNLTNTAVPYTTHCTASSMREFNFFYGEIVYKCNPPTEAGISPGASANFTFSQPDGVFTVNQTWAGEEHEHGHEKT